MEKYNVLSENYLASIKASKSKAGGSIRMNNSHYEDDFQPPDEDEIGVLEEANRDVRLDLKPKGRKRKHDSGGGMTAEESQWFWGQNSVPSL